jgi:hypothetical protein
MTVLPSLKNGAALAAFGRSGLSLIRRDDPIETVWLRLY